MMGEWGQVSRAEIDAAVAIHAATLDAHTKDVCEILRTGVYYSSVNAARINRTLTANQLEALPFLAARDMTIDRIAIEVTTLANPGTVRLGIYSNGTNLYPGALLLDAGEVSVTTTGIKAVIINQALPKGIYYLALLSSHAPIVWGEQNNGCVSFPQGLSASNFGYIQCGWRKAQAYGALPDPFTAGGGLNYDSTPPRIAVRILSLD